MTIKRKSIIEISIAFLLIGISLYLILPKFHKSQVKGSVDRVHTFVNGLYEIVKDERNMADALSGLTKSVESSYRKQDNGSPTNQAILIQRRDLYLLDVDRIIEKYPSLQKPDWNWSHLSFVLNAAYAKEEPSKDSDYSPVPFYFIIQAQFGVRDDGFYGEPFILFEPNGKFCTRKNRDLVFDPTNGLNSEGTYSRDSFEDWEPVKAEVSEVYQQVTTKQNSSN